MLVFTVPFVVQQFHSFTMPTVELVSGELSCFEQHVQFEIILMTSLHQLAFMKMSIHQDLGNTFDLK